MPRRTSPRSTLEPPLGSGPYTVKDFKPGEYVAYARRDDYWAKDLPVNEGRYNFDEIRFEYFRERTAGLRSAEVRHPRSARGIHLARLGDRL